MSKQTDFIKIIAPLAQAEYKNRSKWVLPSVCIAQAALESGWNPKAKTLFGIKGTGNSLKTTEYINGKYIETTASFKSYPSIAASVHGYYDLITANTRYAKAVNNADYRSAIQAIYSGGYATDPNYVNKVVSIITSYALTTYDSFLNLKESESKENVVSDLDQVVSDVIKGVYGNGKARKTALAKAGYDYEEIQKLVNERLKNEKH